MATGPDRQRIVTWSDPGPAAARGRDLAGLEYLRAIVRGDVPGPPIAALLGILLVSVEEGRAVFAAVPGEEHYNPLGVVHGGIAATLLDSAMGCAVHTTLPAGTAYTTLEIKVNFVRPVTVSTGRIVAEGKVVYRGGTIATAEGRLYAEADGSLLAHSTTTCLILRPKETSQHGATIFGT